jgi:hypothetical protein
MLTSVDADWRPVAVEQARSAILDQSFADEYRIIWAIRTAAAAPRFGFDLGRPSMAAAWDSDGGPLLVQLLVSDGVLDEIEWFKADDTPIRSTPHPNRFQLYDTLEGEEMAILPPGPSRAS